MSLSGRRQFLASAPAFFTGASILSACSQEAESVSYETVAARTWHLGSVFGWAFAGVLLRLAVAPHDSSAITFVLSAIVFANLGGSLLVLIGTKGRHPGWIALLAVAALTWLAAGAA